MTVHLRRGFTIVEVMVVVTIILVLASLATVALNTARMSARDARRVNDINQIRSALNLYYGKYQSYPAAITMGQPFSVGIVPYLETVPANPSPRADNNCPDAEYAYAQTSSGFSYTLTFCLGTRQESLAPGTHTAIPEGIY